MNQTTILKSALWLAVLTSHVLCFAGDLQAQGRLSRVRDAVRRHDPPRPHQTRDDDDHDDHHHESKKKKRKKRHRSRHGHHHCPGFSLNLFYDDCCPPPVVEHVYIYEPAPLILAQSPTPPPDLIPGPPVVVDSIGDCYFACWKGRITAFFGTDFDGLSQGTLGLLLQRPGGFGIDTSVNMFRESGMSFRDHLWIGDFNVVYEVINTGNFRARLGGGLNWLGDHYGGEAGGNLTMSADWQLNHDWVLTGEVDLGSLGDTDLFHGQLSIGRQIGQAEWTFGYDYYDIGGTSLNGVFTGLRFRF